MLRMMKQARLVTSRFAKFLQAAAFGGTVALALLSQTGTAQQPLYLPADIPLDVSVIYQELMPEPEYADITQDIIRQLTRNHYSEINFNDTFSSEMLDSFIKTLDGARIYFTQADIDEFESYRTRLDDMLLEGDVSFGYLMFNRYRERLMERLVYYGRYRVRLSR